ncbi:MAG: putative addiction module antidote protein [Fibrobacteres bacterium]|nr:putative addiction module antidote protein [Fibrobacterota bacterium]
MGGRSSPSSLGGRSGDKPKISKGKKDIGRITKKERPARAAYETYLHPALRDDPDRALGYLTECFNDEYEETFLVALKDVVLAHGGMAKISMASGLNRESLYKALSRGGNPGVDTLRKILAALKVKIAFVKA